MRCKEPEPESAHALQSDTVTQETTSLPNPGSPAACDARGQHGLPTNSHEVWNRLPVPVPLEACPLEVTLTPGPPQGPAEGLGASQHRASTPAGLPPWQLAWPLPLQSRQRGKTQMNDLARVTV